MIQAFLDFLTKYPGAWALIVPITWGLWGILTALLTAALGAWIPDTDEKWALLFAKRPRLAPYAGILKYGGTATWSVLRSVKAIFAGPPPSLAVPRTPEDIKALEAIVAAQIKAAALGAPAPTAADKAAISTRS